MPLSKSARIREMLPHPVIDSDGHTRDFDHLFEQYIAQVGGAQVLEQYKRGPSYTFIGPGWYKATAEERQSHRIVRPAWWGIPSGRAMDLATAKLPKLLYERLPEAGLDVSVIFAGEAINLGMINDQEIRAAVCRASNLMHMDMFRKYEDRIIPVAVVPAHSPAEAIVELEYCVRELGFRAFTMPSFIRRPIPKLKEEFPRLFWLDTYGIDSEHDYDPLWKKCIELGVSPTFHSASSGMGFRASISNFVYNHIGHFAQSGEAVCKSLFMGGVTRRFPDLRFAFMEGGISWAVTLCSDLVGHWKKRNIGVINELDPARMDRTKFFQLCEQYGENFVGGMMSTDKRDALIPSMTARFKEDPSTLDEFSRIGIRSVEDIKDLFIKPFFFGCEGDDPTNGMAFNALYNPLHAKLNAVFGSDIGHFDVPDIAGVLDECYEAVEHGAISEDDFRNFVFENPIRLWTAANPRFFDGTVVEKEVSSFLAANTQRPGR